MIKRNGEISKYRIMKRAEIERFKETENYEEFTLTTLLCCATSSANAVPTN